MQTQAGRGGIHDRLFPLIAAVFVCFSVVPDDGNAAGSSRPDLDRTVDFHIAAQPLDRALLEFSREAHIELAINAREISGAEAPAVTGALAARSALTQLLRETGLKYETVGNTIAISQAAPGGSSTGSTKPPSTAAKNSRQTSTTATEANTDLAEVVVTAQKREERLKDVPISISVLSGDSLDNSSVQGVTEALGSVPGVSAVAHSQGGGTFISVRGVTASGPVFGGSSPIAYYLDSVPFGLVQTAIVPDANAYDLERVEVLRGPQGTLYGQSAQGGVVRVLTHDADLNDFEVKARTDGSSTWNGAGNYGGDMAVNVPIIDGKLAARAVVGYENWSGWINSASSTHVNTAELRNYRLKVKAQPSDSLTIGLSFWRSHDDYGAPNASDDNFHTAHVAPSPLSVDYDASGLKVGYDAASFSVTSMTSYLHYSTKDTADYEDFNSPAIFAEHFGAYVVSEELNLSSKTEGPWRWTAGAMYRDAVDHDYQEAPDFGLLLDWTNGSRSYAVFGELSRKFWADRFEWTLGARYFHDDVTSREDPYAPPVNPPDYYFAENAFVATTPRAVVSWFVDPEVTMYASYSEGYRSGTPQAYYVTGGKLGFPAVKPDKLHNFEIGAKGDLADHRLSVDSALYYMDWKDVQQQLEVPFSGSAAGVSALVNAPSASGFGFDLGITARPTTGLELSTTFSGNKLTVDRDVISAGAVLFAKGDRLNFSPEYTIGASAAYVFSLGFGFKGHVAASETDTAAQSFRTILGGVQSISQGNNILMARLSFAVESPEHWLTTFYADNINNERGRIYGSPFGATVPDTYLRVRPRTVGVRVDYRL